MSRSRSRSPMSRSRSRSPSLRGYSPEPPIKDTTNSVFVGELRDDVNEDDLRSAFSRCGEVVEAKINREESSSKQFAMISFSSSKAIREALKLHHRLEIVGGRITVYDNSRSTTLFVGNAPTQMGDKELERWFSKRGGPVMDVRVKNNYCFLIYESFFKAEMARRQLKGRELGGKTLTVQLSIADKEQHKESGGRPDTSKTVYVGNLTRDTEDEDLNEHFKKFGPLARAAVARDPEGKSKGFAFVEFEQLDDSIAAVESKSKELNGETIRVEFSTGGRRRAPVPPSRSSRGGRDPYMPSVMMAMPHRSSRSGRMDMPMVMPVFDERTGQYMVPVDPRDYYRLDPRYEPRGARPTHDSRYDRYERGSPRRSRSDRGYGHDDRRERERERDGRYRERETRSSYSNSYDDRSRRR